MKNINNKNASDRPKTPLRVIPRVAALHDLSSFGRCALTVVMPALSAMGVQCVPIPTALLSTHTGGFSDMYFCDLGRSIDPIGEHLSSIGVDFDAIYPGFLGSPGQVHSVADFISRFTPNDGRRLPIIFVDPVMGDDGVLYSACLPELVCEMRALIASADVIVPNLTEACLLVGEPYTEPCVNGDNGGNGGCDCDGDALALADMISARLHDITPARAVITGIRSGDRVGTYFNGEIHWERRRGRDYPGTGDIFASVMLGRLLTRGRLGNDCAVSDDAVRDASDYASAYTARVIGYSEEYGADLPVCDGVLLEGCLSELTDNARSDSKKQ